MIATLRALERFLLPNHCIVCRQAVSGRTPDRLVCAVCEIRLGPVARGCPRCAQPKPPVGPCRFCVDWPEGLVSATSAVWLGDEAAAMVHSLKYRGMRDLAERMAEIMIRHVPRTDGVLIPVPTTAGRLRVRGYNQAELLAVALARRWDQPVDVAGLERSGDHASQVLLGPLARRANVQDAFRASGPAGPGAPAVLVDDVLTTGATVVAAAQALLAAGWDVVAGVTFARARTYQRRVMDVGA